MAVHKPVLTKEALEYLDPKPNENFIDGTMGEAGHTVLILEKNAPEGRVLGIDQDFWQIENSKLATSNFKKRVVLVNDSYANLQLIVKENNFKPVSGILLDLGYSSWQLEKSKKGFSFQKNEILDMRYDIENILTAEKIVNEYSEDELRRILKEYGEERFAKQIAKKIIAHRGTNKIKSSFELVSIIEKAIPSKFRHGKIHCASRTFQALRIEVNDELNNLIKVLPDALSILSLRGRLVVISFHSLEDRIVKNFFKDKEKEKLVKILTPKPITATDREILANPRSRSAKLRAIVKIKN